MPLSRPSPKSASAIRIWRAAVSIALLRRARSCAHRDAHGVAVQVVLQLAHRLRDRVRRQDVERAKEDDALNEDLRVALHVLPARVALEALALLALSDVLLLPAERARRQLRSHAARAHARTSGRPRGRRKSARSSSCRPPRACGCRRCRRRLDGQGGETALRGLWLRLDSRSAERKPRACTQAHALVRAPGRCFTQHAPGARSRASCSPSGPRTRARRAEWPRRGRRSRRAPRTSCRRCSRAHRRAPWCRP